MIRLLCFLAAVTLCHAPPSTASGAAARAEAAAVTGAAALRVDGEMTNAVWLQAPVVSDFRQRDPNDGAAPSFETKVRVAYDATSIYIAVQALDPEPSKIVGMLTRRDTGSPSDWIRVAIDSYHDRRTAYEFAVNPAGVKQDKYWFNDSSEDSTWDAVWDVAVARDATGWTAEFRIPFSQLRFQPRASSVIGLAVVRQVGRLNETCTWPHLSKSANGYVSSFGELTGLTLDRSAKRLELVPYSVAELTRQTVEEDDPLSRTSDPDLAGGLDLKYALTPGLTLTGTLNPDFGQVEADPAVVNLSAFETFFAERRPFFVEGAGTFRFDIDCNDGVCSGLFYSRRIGRQPQGEDELPEDGYNAVPDQTTILGAAKLTGRVGGFSLGALNAVTSRERATVVNGGDPYRVWVEPFTSYSVVRARREFANQSSLGFMTTATNRRLEDSLSFLAGNAFTGGVDWDVRLARAYAITGYWAGSRIHGSTEAITRLQESNVHSFQRPDASHVELDPTATTLNGHGAFVAFSKIAGERVRFNFNAAMKSPGFDINDVGFMRRADQRTMSNWLQWRNERPSRYIRSFRINFNQWAGWNFGGDRLYSGSNVNAHTVFTNNWSTGAGLNVNGREFDDRLTRGGPGGLRNGSWSLWHYLNTDDRKPIFLTNNFNYANDLHDTRTVEFVPSLTIRPTAALSMSAGVSFVRNFDDSQWIESEELESSTRYIFGRLSQTTLGLRLRGNYTMTPTLSIELYAEPFVSVGDYASFKELVNGRAPRYEGRYVPASYGDNPDFNYKSFRTTNVLRWEYKPGSTLFVVWQQGREDETERGDFRFRRDFGDIFRAPARNVLLVKLAYWVNF